MTEHPGQDNIPESLSEPLPDLPGTAPYVPEVIPAEHILPESAPISGDDAFPTEATFEPAPAFEAPTFIEPAAKTVSARSATSASTAAKPKSTPRGSNGAGSTSTSTANTRARSKEHLSLVLTFSTARSLVVTFAAAVIVATIFMWWTSPDFLAASARGPLARAQATAERVLASPTFLPTPIWFNRIGVVAGHSGIATYGPTKGNVDPGTVCPDGFNEATVTMNTAKQVVALLRGRGFTVDLLEEFDLKLDGYQAAAFISLHADACDNFNDGFNHTGFKVTNPTERYSARDRDLQLNDCVRDNYSSVTGLPFTPGSITQNMTEYHAFHKLAPTTPAVILELGFLSYDRDLLQNHTDKLAQGVMNGLLCFLQPTSLPPSPIPVASPTRGVASPTAKR